MVSKERMMNAGWTVGSVIIALAIYDIVVAPFVDNWKKPA